MKSSTALIRTDRASRYLVQLCKHFGHKVPVEWTETDGVVRFEPGTCRMAASGDALTLSCESETQDALAVVQDVVARHLERFAWKEAFSVAWVSD